MLYIRSSFVDYLKGKPECSFKPMRDGKGLFIKSTYGYFNMFMTRNIDFEEIMTACTKLCVETPMDKDLERAE